MAAYEIRSLAALSAQARGFFTQSIPGTVARLSANTFTVVGKVVALVGFEIELRRAWLSRQIFASTADKAWLLRHGFELGLQPFPARAARGSVTIAAPTGLVVPAGLAFAAADGTSFTTTATATAAGGQVSVPIEADTAGAAGNREAGTALDALYPDALPAGLGLQAVVVDAGAGSGLAGGADAELLEPFRARVLARKRQVAQGGNAGDYAGWVADALGSALEAVFVDSFANDARWVWVAFLVNDQANRIPSPAQVALAQAALDDPAIRPVQARPVAVTLTPVPVPILIGNLAPDTDAVRASIAAEIAATFIDRAEPGRPGKPFVLSRSWIDEAISRATGEDSHDLLTPAGNVVFQAGQMPIPGGITYTTE